MMANKVACDDGTPTCQGALSAGASVTSTAQVVAARSAGVHRRRMPELLGPLLLFAAVMSLTPGPNVVMVTASAANFGFGRTIPQILGITVGFGVLIMAVGLGLASLVHASRACTRC